MTDRVTRNLLSSEDYEELSALADANTQLCGPSFIGRSHWHPQYERLVGLGFVKWGSPPNGFSPDRFAGIEITDAGRAALVDQRSVDKTETP